MQRYGSSTRLKIKIYDRFRNCIDRAHGLTHVASKRRLLISKVRILDFVRQDQKLKLSLNSPLSIQSHGCGAIKKVRCVSHVYGYEFVHFQGNMAQYDDEKNKCYFIVPSVTEEMSDRWMCNFERNNVNDKIFFDVQVQGIQPKHTMLVNSVVQKTKKNNTDSFVTSYEYLAGDDIDLSCVSPAPFCDVQLEYEDFELLNDSFRDLSSKTAVGFRTKLQPRHNDTRVICKCSCRDGLTVSIALTFKLKKKLDGIMKVKINGLTVRGERRVLRSDNITTVIYNIGHSDNKHTVKCSTDNQDITISSKYDKNYKEKKYRWRITTEVTVDDDYSKVIYTANKIDPSGVSRIQEIVRITFTSMDIPPSSSLSINLPKTNILMEAYKYECYTSRYSYYVYEYHDGEQLTLNCSAPTLIPYGFININGTVYKEISDETIQHVKLTSADNHTFFKCERLTYDKKTVMSQINVLFLMNTYESKYDMYNNMYNSETDVETNNGSTLLAVAAIICIALICVAIAFIYMSKKRKQRAQEGEQNLINIQSGTTIPPYPAQWNTNNMKTNNYTNKNVLRETENAFYAQVIPKCQRKGKDEENIYENNTIEAKKDEIRTSELNYASLDFEQAKYVNKENTPNVDSNAVYAEIRVNEKDDNLYNNIGNNEYGNNIESEYIEPTYSEVLKT
ncbi:uncharacterized protein LOC142980601 [Anticarsia gemmatalis]|uniref:uncharacterized protein LOC142980601 n=1 Tax=Anticarsia gemmatalis TaxID=129554 RepID=UPI003F771EF0